MKTYKNRRAKEIALIHIAKAELGMDEKDYRSFIKYHGGEASAKDLSSQGRFKVLKAFIAAGADINIPAPFSSGMPTPEADKAPLIRKIDAILYDINADRNYVRAMAKRMFQEKAVDVLEWTPVEQLRKLASALSYHQRRVHGD